MPYRPSVYEYSRMVLGIWGAPKTGKTHFLLTAPQPIRLINTDHGFMELLRKPEFRDIDIVVEDIVEDIRAGTLGSFESAQAALALFHETYTAWIEEMRANPDQPGTIAIDNATFLWELVQYVKLEEAKRARFEKQNKIQKFEDMRDQRFDYGPVNHYYNVMMRAIYNTKGSLILTHESHHKYNERGEETSVLQMRGFRATAAVVQAVCQTYKDGKDFRLLITHSRDAPEQEGLWLPNPSFGALTSMLHG